MVIRGLPFIVNIHRTTQREPELSFLMINSLLGCIRILGTRLAFNQQVPMNACAFNEMVFNTMYCVCFKACTTLLR